MEKTRFWCPGEWLSSRIHSSEKYEQFLVTLTGTFHSESPVTEDEGNDTQSRGEVKAMREAERSGEDGEGEEEGSEETEDEGNDTRSGRDDEALGEEEGSEESSESEKSNTGRDFEMVQHTELEEK